MRRVSLLLTGLCLLLTPAVAPAVAAPARISGSGSSWAANAVQQWQSDLQAQGQTVDYTPDGSLSGLHEFAGGRVDFAVSDLTYQTVGQTPPANSSSLPLVAGGVDFVYRVTVGGQAVTGVRLSGPTLAAIFSGRITNWNDAAITADNNGRRIAADLPLVPVVRSDAAAVSDVVTDWFTQRFGATWTSFSRAGATPYFPIGPATVAQAGAIGVATYTANTNGALGIVENSYALSANLPIAAIENPAGYFVTPAAGAVSLALLQAKAPMSAPARLAGVFADADPRAYPLSYVAYGLVPTRPGGSVDVPRLQGVVDLMGYGICGGQRSAAPLGYAPLPINLVRAAIGTLRAVHRQTPAVDIGAVRLGTCANPTIDRTQRPPADDLGTSVPQPPACARYDAGPCPATSARPGP